MKKSEIEKLSVEQLVSRYGIIPHPHNNGMLRVSKYSVDASGDGEKVAMDAIKARKPEILAHFAELEKLRKEQEEEKQRKEAERRRKIDAIPGLKELDAAYNDLESWGREFDRSFEGEYAVGGMGVRPKPQYDIKGLEAKYPAATAYRKARGKAYSGNYEVAAYGKEAMRMIEDDPANYTAAMEYMERENEAFVNRHIWD